MIECQCGRPSKSIGVITGSPVCHRCYMREWRQREPVPKRERVLAMLPEVAGECDHCGSTAVRWLYDGTEYHDGTDFFPGRLDMADWVADCGRCGFEEPDEVLVLRARIKWLEARLARRTAPASG